MTKKLFTLLLAVAASVGTMFAAPVRIGDLYYNLDAATQTAEVAENSSASGEIIIPSSVTYNSVSYSVTSIGDRAFRECIGLTSVTIPNSVTSIGERAFYLCSGLTSVTIPNSVTSIGGSAFYGCTGLTSVTIPNSVTSIGEYAFAYCDGLTSIDVASDNSNYCSVDGVLFNKDKTTLIQYPGDKQGAYTIPNSVTSIGESAFEGCSSLTSMTIPNSVTSIGEEAFRFCAGLTSVTIPGSVTSIGGGAFFECRGLTSIDVASDNSNYCSVDGVLFNKDKTTLIQYPGGKQGAYTIPNSVTSIGESAFAYCDGLTSVTIPNSVTSLGYAAFLGCTGLTSVTIGNSVTSIGEWAFFGCYGLKSVTIPNSVTSIGESAFAYCTGLTSVTNFANTPQEIDSDVFYGVNQSTCVLYVPAGSISAYQSADGWKNFTNILPISQQGLEDVQGNNVQCTKVVRDGHIFILRGEKVYNAQGALVK